VDVLDGVKVLVTVDVTLLVGLVVKVAVREGVDVFEGTDVALAGIDVRVEVLAGVIVAVLPGVEVRDAVLDGTAVKVLEAVAEGMELAIAVFEALAVRVGVLVMLGVLEAVRVAVGSAVFVEVPVALLSGVAEGVFVIVGASPSNTNVPEAFHSLPTKMRTSYVPGSHFSTGCCHTADPMPVSDSSQVFVSKLCSSPSRYQIAVHCTPGCMSS
jgi:hypothetical protein